MFRAPKFKPFHALAAFLILAASSSTTGCLGQAEPADDQAAPCGAEQPRRCGPFELDCEEGPPPPCEPEGPAGEPAQVGVPAPMDEPPEGVLDDEVDEQPIDEPVCESVFAEHLGFRVIDAEYSARLDRIIAVSAEPDALHVYDPRTGDHEVVELDRPPTSVSVAPDGMQAVVGHDALITHVDLLTPRVLDVLPITIPVLDVVLADNGFVYAFPARDQWASVHSLRLETGEEVASSGHIYAGTLAKLHPDGDRMYGADNGLSPSDLERYDIEGGVAEVAGDSPYHGDHSVCGDLWMSEDGARVFTRCGVVFRATNALGDDMTYNGSLPVEFPIGHLVHSAAAGRIALVAAEPYRYRPYEDEADEEAWVYLFGDDFFGSEGAMRLPCFEVGARHFAGRGRFVFARSDGSELYVIAQADEESTLIADFAVATFQLADGG